MKKFNTKYRQTPNEPSAFIPNSFQMTNAYVDNIMCHISDAAHKIYTITVRKTTGWQKQYDSISLSQYEAFSGKSRPTVVRCLKELVKFGLLVKHESTRYGCTYSVALLNDLGFELLTTSKNILLVKKFNYTSKNILLPLVKIFNTQKTLSKNTNQKTINKDWFSLKTLKDELKATGLPIEAEDLKAAIWFDREKTAFENYAPNKSLTDPQKMYYFVDWLLKAKRKYDAAERKQAAKKPNNANTEQNNGIKEPVIRNSYVLTPLQIITFSKQLCNLPSFGKYCPGNKSFKEFEMWIASRLNDPKQVEKWASYLNELGFVFH